MKWSLGQTKINDDISLEIHSTEFQFNVKCNINFFVSVLMYVRPIMASLRRRVNIVVSSNANWENIFSGSGTGDWENNHVWAYENVGWTV